MPDRNRARPAILRSHNYIMRKKGTLKRLTRKVGRLRDELQVMKQLYETDKAELEEKERELAQQKKWNDQAFTQDALVRQAIAITLDMFEAQDGGDHLTPNTIIMPFFSEVVPDHVERRTAGLLSAGRQQE